MVTLDYIERSAMNAYRKKGNEMSRAFLEALGIYVVPSPIVLKPGGAFSEKYGDIDFCFKNTESVLDRPI
jgi:hypothetical protein